MIQDNTLPHDLIPNPFGLLSVASVSEYKEEDNAWMRYTSHEYNSDAFALRLLTINDASVSNGALYNNTSAARFLEYRPFGFEVEDYASNLGVLHQDRLERVKLITQASTQKIVERELWAGTAAIDDIIVSGITTPNNFLQKPNNAVDVTVANPDYRAAIIGNATTASNVITYTVNSYTPSQTFFATNQIVTLSNVAFTGTSTSTTSFNITGSLTSWSASTFTIISGSAAGATYAAPATATVTAATGDGTKITYTATNTFTAGQRVSITGLTTTTGSSLNLSNVMIVSRTASQFVVYNSTIGTSSGSGTATIGSIAILNSGGDSPRVALARLEGALAQCGSGLKGVIHMSKQTAIMMYDFLQRIDYNSRLDRGDIEIKNDQILVTTLGTPVVVGTGYTGDGPIGSARGWVATPVSHWMFATGYTDVHLGAIKVVNDNLSQGQVVTNNTNDVRIKALRSAAVHFEPCCHYAVKVDFTATAL
jgi:hypothetical protein